jgi:hypothetical protein
MQQISLEVAVAVEGFKANPHHKLISKLSLIIIAQSSIHLRKVRKVVSVLIR